MTRLKTHDIEFVSETLTEYDRDLFHKTGRTLKGIACHAINLSEDQANRLARPCIVAVVPMTCGKGVIKGFAETVRCVVEHLGFESFVTTSEDIAGLSEAIEKGCHMVVVADDNRFVVVNLREGKLVDNAEATGRGFVSTLMLMAGHLWGERVLTLGCGRVGRSAVRALLERGIDVAVYDVDIKSCHSFVEEVSGKFPNVIRVEENLDTALNQHRLLIDATPARDIIAAKNVKPDTYISAPGVPIGLTPAAVRKVSDRLIHDPLRIGLATMVFGAVSLGLYRFCSKVTTGKV